jgi:hypothetical protein
VEVDEHTSESMDLARMGITRRWTRAHTAPLAGDAETATEDEDTQDETVTENENEMEMR